MIVDYNKALQMAKLIHIAGQVIKGGFSDDLKAEITSLGYTFQQMIIGNDHKGDAVTFGFAALSNSGELVVAIRGTDPADIWEWLKDTDVLLVPSSFSGLIHFGFKQVYDSLRLVQQPGANEVKIVDYINSLVATKQADTVYTTGHSLGGALATLLEADIEKNTPVDFADGASYTFASPRTGDHIFSYWYNWLLEDLTFRFEHACDIVPMLPGPPFEHVGTKIRLGGDFGVNIATNHELNTYIKLIEEKLASTNRNKRR